MPFDALVAAPPQRLSDVLAAHDIAPVSGETLAAHKQAQLRTFRPSFWYRHPLMLGAALIASVLAMAATLGLAQALGQPSLRELSLGWMGLMALLLANGGRRVRAGAHWEERRVAANRLEALGVPEPIARLGRMLQTDAPGSTLVLGELLEDAVVLDPYLLLCQRGEMVCLGIWDGTRCIACAGVDHEAGLRSGGTSMWPSGRPAKR